MTEKRTPTASPSGPPRGLKIALAVLAGLVLLVVAARIFLITPPGRALVVAMADGRHVGRFGRLDVQGLHGDVLSKFSLDRATVSDANGVWLEARDLKVDWSPARLLARRFQARSVTARTVRILRRPEIPPNAGPFRGLPVSIHIDHFTSDVELMSGFAKEYGRWSAAGNVVLARHGRQRGTLRARSLSRPGDFLTVDFDLGGRRRMLLSVEAHEAKGGPIAGALGYSPGQPFVFDVRANGSGSQGGAFTATATSGPFTPLRADGRWSEAGGSAKGVVAFAGSDLFRSYLDKLGPEARFDTSFQRKAGGRYALQWTLAAENLASRGQGVIDAKPLGSQAGVRLTVSTPSASRLLGQELSGPAGFDGTWTGTFEDWRLAGALTAHEVTSDDYRLASVSGPIRVHAQKGVIDGQARLEGAGGSGADMLAKLLGARPKAQLDVRRLVDGALMIQRFDLDGADLTVRAAGSRGLTGGFNFQGKAEVPRVAALHPGGRGALNATWRAAASGADRPWSLGFVAEGRDFASGLGQLDRLLGPTPKLTANGQFQHGVVRLERAALTGKAGQATGSGTATQDGKLDLKLDWSARGPFEAGPVTIAGDARGSGRLKGTLLRPEADLNSRFDQIDLMGLALQNATVELDFAKDPKGYDGSVALHAASAYGPAHAQSRFAFTQAGIRLDQLSLNGGGVQAQGSLALSRGAPSEADLAFSAGPGAFLARGSAKGTVRLAAADGANAAVEVSGSNLAFRNSPLAIDLLHLSGHGPLSHLPFTASAAVGGDIQARFDGMGVYSQSGETQTVSLSGSGKVRDNAWRTLQPVVVSLTPAARSLQADLSVGGGRLTAQARQTQAGFDAKADLAGVNIATFNSRLVGQISGTASATGRGAQLTGSLDGRLQNLRDADAPETSAVNGEIRASLAGDRLHMDGAARDGAGGSASADVDLPVVASAEPLHLAIARTRPMSGRFALQGEVRPYWDLFAGGETSLTGKASTQGTIGGTLDQPAIVGRAQLQDAKFQDARSGMNLQKLALTVDFNQRDATLQSLQADDGHGGTITGEGRVDLAKGGASSFTITLHRFQLLDNDEANARASGPLTLTRAADGKIKLSGKLRIDRAVISPNPPVPSGVVNMEVVEINRPAGRGGHYAPPETGPAIELDITLNAPGQILVRGRGLNAELSLNAHVGGTTRDPQLTGRAEVARGDYTFGGKRFDFDPNGYIELSTHVADMRLNLQAEYSPPTGGLTATVHVQGTAAKPQVTITSVPSLPPDEILSQILFGGSASQLSTTQSAQIGAATASLAAGGLDVLSNLGQLAGLDVLTFGSEASNLTVTGGKYVGNNLYLEVVGGGQGGTSVQADWRVRRNLSIISAIAGQGYSKLSIFWRKEFH